MKRYLVVLILLLITFNAVARDNSTTKPAITEQYRECVAVSLFTMQGRELNSAVKNNRAIEKTNVIPKGWTVIGVTTKDEADVTAPYLVICH